MSPRMMRVVVGGVLLLICTTAVVLHSSKQVDFAELSNADHLRTPEERIHIKRRILSRLQVSQFGYQSDVKCVGATLGNLSFPVCIYGPQNDKYVSKLIGSGKYFEQNLVQKILNFFLIHPDLSFVDLGANLGTYSLPIAHSGIHVVSVEPNKDTVRRLAKSVHLGRIENNVDIFPYALSNEESTTFLKIDAVNRGNTFMAHDGSCSGCLSAEVTVLNKLLPFIKHKKVFIKIDTQEAEIKIFQRQSAAKFFDEIDVVMIQMEWHFYPSRYG